MAEILSISCVVRLSIWKSRNSAESVKILTVVKYSRIAAIRQVFRTVPRTRNGRNHPIISTC